MNTFLWIHDYQWNAISSIATALGVLLALFIPMNKRKQEKKNLIYFHAKSFERILDEIRSINDLYNESHRTESDLLYFASQITKLEIPQVSTEAKELIKYDTKLYEAIVELAISISMVQLRAKDLVEFKTPELRKECCDALKISMGMAECQIFEHYDYLLKRKFVKYEWVPFSMED